MLRIAGKEIIHMIFENGIVIDFVGVNRIKADFRRAFMATLWRFLWMLIVFALLYGWRSFWGLLGAFGGLDLCFWSYFIVFCVGFLDFWPNFKV